MQVYASFMPHLLQVFYASLIASFYKFYGLQVLLLLFLSKLHTQNHWLLLNPHVTFIFYAFHGRPQFLILMFILLKLISLPHCSLQAKAPLRGEGFTEDWVLGTLKLLASAASPFAPTFAPAPPATTFAPAPPATAFAPAPPATTFAPAPPATAFAVAFAPLLPLLLHLHLLLLLLLLLTPPDPPAPPAPPAPPTPAPAFDYNLVSLTLNRLNVSCNYNHNCSFHFCNYNYNYNYNYKLQI